MKRKIEDQYAQDLHNILSNSYGRRFLLRLINTGRAVPAIGIDPHTTYFNQGMRCVADNLEADLRENHFDLWALALREAKGEDDSSCNPSDE